MRVLNTLCALCVAATLLPAAYGQPSAMDFGNFDNDGMPWDESDNGYQISDEGVTDQMVGSDHGFVGCATVPSEWEGCTPVAPCCQVLCQPRWCASAEALFLWRDNHSTDQPVVLNSATDQTLLTTGSLNFDTEVGMRFTLGRRIGERYAIEWGYFGVEDWSAAAAATGANNLRLPGDLALASFDYFDADQMRVDYWSRIRSAEVGLVRCGKLADVLCGFRYVEFDEGLNINALDGTRSSDYGIRARNSLYGAQLGARACHDWKRVQATLVGKAGLYGGDSRQGTDIGDFNNQISLRSTHASHGNLAFVGEAGVNLSVTVRRGLCIVGGYNMVWIEGVALAPNQLDFTDTPTSSQFVDTDGGVLFHGANAGIECRW